MLRFLLPILVLAVCAPALAAAQDVHAYIANSGESTVSVIDTATDTVIDTIVVGEGPQATQWHPDGTRVYVGLNGLADGDNNKVAVIDTRTRTVIKTIEMTHGGPEGMAFNPDGSLLYVATAGIHQLPPDCFDVNDFVTVIDTATNEEVGAFEVLLHPWDVGVRSNGEVWVSNAHSETLTFYDPEGSLLVENDLRLVGDGCDSTNEPGNLDYHTAVMAERPNHDEIWISHMHTDLISRYDGATHEEMGSWLMKDDDCPNQERMCEHSMGLAWDHEGENLFIGMFFKGEVRKYHGDTMTELGRVDVGLSHLSGPKSFDLHPDGIRLYVGLQGEEERAVEVLDVRDMTVINRIPVGANPIPFGNFIGTVAPLEGQIFTDGFESGNADLWAPGS